MRALVVEDDPVSTRLLEYALVAEGIVVECSDTGEDALELAKIYDFDVVTVDLGLPDMDGATLIRRLRNARIDTPVIVVSADARRDEKVRVLLAGADGYLAKPFDRDELRAHIQAVVRRTRGYAASRILLGRMTIDLATRSVDIDGRSLKITAKEYGILELLALRKGQPLTKEAFLDHLYGGRDEPEQKIIDVFICKLRKKIAAMTTDAHNIETVWGRGYVLNDLPAAAGGGVPGLAEAGTVFALEGGPGVSEAELLIEQIFA
ncbi:MAG: response regulator transcription factor [Geminicoccaceae bacterium]|nr:response regulator transcription factor [Geminicoccaceae bacterium]